MAIQPPTSLSGLKLKAECKAVALKSVARGRSRARNNCKAVLSYVFSNPTEIKPFGTAAFVKVAFEDPNHPARKHRPFSPELEKNTDLIDRLIDTIPLRM